MYATLCHIVEGQDPQWSVRQLSCSVKPVTDYKLTRHGMDEARETSSKEDQDQSLVGFVQSLVGFVQSLVVFGKMLFFHSHLSPHSSGQ